MSIDPLLDASHAIQLHVLAALLALVVGVFLLAGKKGTGVHRLLGRLWIALMIATALSSFFIRTIDVVFGFGPIHLLSVLVLHGCGEVVYSARRGQIEAHRRHVTTLYAMALLGAGAFTLLPGRAMHRVFFGGDDGNGYFLALFAILLVAAFVFVRLGHRRFSLPLFQKS
ncbi:DUF2306 domain-containing protein [Peteryoungia desertarenae]|uniref:DUF2306 domain-containing protein n=1 Tax=Peteryoungia desertarenae TaxID=1813451 RepID=A0ABX6QQJ5_9HYPH|nr:DUF2306 domain-containing protein [Peteryoungia desertarenae]QLF70916.1 DUF2306 domain-containing protein [Peteryoungia desertarenae]